MCDFLQRWPLTSTNADSLEATGTQPSAKDQERWTRYYDAVTGRPPRPTLLTALERFEVEREQDSGDSSSEGRSRLGTAVDLGCGDGRDTVELLRRNWRVLAIDGEVEAIARLRQRDDINRMYLETRVQRFEDLVLPPEVDLINASFCLPFCPPSHFANLWDEIVIALRSGGRFCGHLFGDRDSWAIYDDVSSHTRAQVEALLEPFEVDFFDEEDHPGKTALGEDKHWHLFNIVARKR